jgi:hypothetical protein
MVKAGGFSLASLFGGLAGRGARVPPGGGGNIGITPERGMQIAKLGMRMLAPPASPIGQGAPAPTLSTAGQHLQVTQFQQMFAPEPTS